MSYFVGIDPASGTTGLAAISETGALKHQAVHLNGDLPDRLVNLRTIARRWLASIAEEGAWCCVVERPSTVHGGASLFASYGVLIEAARSSLACPVIVLGTGEWKRHACGNGAAKKPDVMAMAVGLGYEGGLQDVADALGCAVAARVLTEQTMRAA